jgi:ribosomal protein S18 acetylase RimI-like enzyme
MTEIIVRKYADNDETTLKKYMANYDNRHYVKNIDDWSRDKLYVAEYAGVIAGYLLASTEPDNCQVFIYISPKYRRKGIGAALCCEAEKQCREKGEKEMWGYYYDIELVGGFTDKLGFYSTSSSIDMEYADGILPENEKAKNIRKCGEEDYIRCQYLWNKGYYELQLRIGNSDASMLEPKEDFDKDTAENWYVLEENGQIVGCGCINENEITALAVDTEVNNKGYGTVLTIFLTNEILRRGNAKARLCVESKNENARHIYEKIGYKMTDVFYGSHKKIE